MLPVAVPLDDVQQDEPAPEQSRKPVPVTLITGELLYEVMGRKAQRSEHRSASRM